MRRMRNIRPVSGACRPIARRRSRLVVVRGFARCAINRAQRLQQARSLRDLLRRQCDRLNRLERYQRARIF